MLDLGGLTPSSFAFPLPGVQVRAFDFNCCVGVSPLRGLVVVYDFSLIESDIFDKLNFTLQLV
jgi:hypothetical protein